MSDLPRYRQGRIVWAKLRSGKGKKELHPAAIISPTRDVIQPEQFDPRKDPSKVNAVAVIGISTEFERYPPYVLLPYSTAKGGHPITKLNSRCAACIGWYDWVVLDDDVEGCGGDVPPAQMDRIAEAIVGDLRAKLAAKAQMLTNELADVEQLIARLIGPP